jgi:aminopeptidase-like protein
MGPGRDFKTGDIVVAMLWILNLSDGQHYLLDVAIRSGLHFTHIYDAAQLLGRYDLLAKTG